ncbi:GNAT family N-acetyltransferase [Streptomyces sp. YPW6]|uniref:GNAT family N-acetyltransferase n=1 Tax=Streptomyces sp. YPW6 TaxID=2840373 RepID=UPI003D726EEF
MLKPGYTNLDPDWLAPLRERIAAEAPDATTWVYVDSVGHLVLSKVVVPRELRSQGIGTRVMELLIAEADKQAVTTTLSPTREFGSGLRRLRGFYRRFGFSMNGGRIKDYTTAHDMIRLPRPHTHH